MKVNWTIAAALAIAASSGLPYVASAQTAAYHLSDAVVEAGDQPSASDLPGAPVSYNAAYSGGGECTTCQQCQCNTCTCEPEEEAEEETCEPWRLFCQKECGWNVYGFASGGIMANTRGPADNYNGPVTFADRDWGQFNQLYGIVEKTIDTGGCGWDWGGRADILWGSDYVFTMATGLELTQTAAPHWNKRASDGSNPEYGLALPQFYAEVGYNDLSVKLGHFYTTLGYEVVPANGNFFYTHAYTMQYGEPFTHTGALATWKASDEWTVVGAFVNGSDHFDRVVDSGALIAGASWNGGEGLTVAFNYFFSQDEFIFSGPNAGGLSNRNVYSLVVSQTFGCDDEWQYVFQHDLGWQNRASGFADESAEWYGINQYLFYTINDCWKAGMRFEWFRDDDGARVTGLRNPTNAIFGDFFAGNFYELSAGLNWTPSANLTVRPELRYDWFEGVAAPTNNSAQPYGNGTASDQFLIGFDVVYLW